MRANPLIALILLIALPFQSSHACLWDSDTLVTEAAGKGKILDVIVGRFARNPPVYYEARLARVTKEIEQTPDKLELYDDAGVACDRLHRSAEAIAWMEKKAAVLERIPNKEHQYRYHANLGTFQIHQWLAGGALATKVDGALGAGHIRKAIEINPDAHFGREAIQLQAIEWLLEQRGVVADPLLPNLFRNVYEPRDRDMDKSIEGLAGMVSLGAAWESVDVFRTLAECFSANDDASLAYLARLRVEELVDSGKKSFSAEFPDEYTAQDSALQESGHLSKWYAKARKVSDKWQRARTAYIEKQIAAGQHPDTHPAFWKNFNEKKHKSPKLPKDRPGVGLEYYRDQLIKAVGIFALVSVFISLIGVFILRRLSKSKA